jgi:hypothetical protein
VSSNVARGELVGYAVQCVKNITLQLGPNSMKISEIRPSVTTTWQKTLLYSLILTISEKYFVAAVFLILLIFVFCIFLLVFS